MRRAAWPLVISVAVVGILFLAVFPTRTYLAQRRDIAATEQRLHVLTAQNSELAARVQALDSDAAIERLAREQYSLVRPGEEAYAILPAPEQVAPAAAGPVDVPAAARPQSVWVRLADTLSFWN